MPKFECISIERDPEYNKPGSRDSSHTITTSETWFKKCQEILKLESPKWQATAQRFIGLPPIIAHRILEDLSSVLRARRRMDYTARYQDRLSFELLVIGLEEPRTRTACVRDRPPQN